MSNNKCNKLMSTAALESHEEVHNDDKKTYKCGLDCIEEYFATALQLEEHYVLFHGHKPDKIRDDLELSINTDNKCNKPEEVDNLMETTSSDKSFTSLDSDYSLENRPTKNSRKTTPRLTKLIDCKDESESGGNSSEYSDIEPRRVSGSPQNWAKRRVDCHVCHRQVSQLGQHMKIHDPSNGLFECRRGCVRTYYSTRHALDTHYWKCHWMEERLAHRSEVQRTESLSENNKTVVVRALSNEDEKPLVMPQQSRKLCKICGIHRHLNGFGKHMVTHNRDGRPFQCMKGCILTFCTTASALRCHDRVYHPAIENGVDKEKTQSATAVLGQMVNKSQNQSASKSDNRAVEMAPKVQLANSQRIDQILHLAFGIMPEKRKSIKWEDGKMENKRRRQSITKMMMELPADATHEQRRKLIDLYSTCK